MRAHHYADVRNYFWIKLQTLKMYYIKSTIHIVNQGSRVHIFTANYDFPEPIKIVFAARRHNRDLF